MPIGSRRFAFIAATFVAALALARPARAQTGTAGTTGTTTASILADGDIFVGIQQQEGSNLSSFDLARFFNKANCDCNLPVFVYFTLTMSGFAKRALVPTGTVSFWVGSQCSDPLLQKTNCQPLGQVTGGATNTTAGPSSEQIATFMALGRETIKTTTQIISRPLINAVVGDGGFVPTTTEPCTSAGNGFNQQVWAIFDYGSDGSIDFSASTAVFVDLVAPPAPADVTVTPGNEGLAVKWTTVDYATNTDLQGYQILCQRGGGLQVFSDGTFTPAIKSCADTRVGTGAAALDPAFLCSPLLGRSATSYRVSILQNDIFYGATVVSIDVSGNASPADLQFVKPQKTNSFFDVYRNGDITNGGAGQSATPGAATGGFCAVGGKDRLGRWGGGAAASVLVATFLSRARRRRRR